MVKISIISGKIEKGDMMKYMEKFRKFMEKRYGVDSLYIFLFQLYIVLMILNMWFHSRIVTILELLIIYWMFYRVLSKNIWARQKENQMYLKWRRRLLKPFRILKRNYKDRHDYLYKKCCSCHTTLKLPLPDKRGIHHAKCPICQKRLTIWSLRQQKIEIIKKKESVRV